MKSKIILILSYFLSLYHKIKFNNFGKKSVIIPFYSIQNPSSINVGDNVFISEGAKLFCKENESSPTLFIGNGTYIGRDFHVNAWKDVRIGNNVLISDRVHISDATHIYDSIQSPIILQGDRFEGRVHIGDGCWIGVGAVVLPGITLGKNVIVGSNTVVTKSMSDNLIVAGNPAKIIGLRS